MDYEKYLKRMVKDIDIQFNGERPFDIAIHNPLAYELIVRQGTVGAGESYMLGYWDCEQLDVLACQVYQADIIDSVNSFFKVIPALLSHLLLNKQNLSHSLEVAHRHYNLSNDLFERMLDPTMTYSCAYWPGASTLQEAQQNKLDLICRKLHLHPGDKVLDIGCGWGSFAGYAAEKYGVEVTGLTISEPQYEYAKDRYGHLPVTFLLDDYRKHQGTYDKIVSIGMFEHVGPKNYKTFFEAAANLLKPDGLMLLHTIAIDYRQYRSDPWINKYIFPNGHIPGLFQIIKAYRQHFILEDLQNIGAHYDKTLLTWNNNFEQQKQYMIDTYSEQFYRMWRYYLLTCAGVFRARKLQVYHLVLSKNGLAGGWHL